MDSKIKITLTAQQRADKIRAKNRPRTTALLTIKRNKLVLIDPVTGFNWANEYFSNIQDVKQIMKDNNVTFTTPEEIKLKVEGKEIPAPLKLVIGFSRSAYDFIEKHIDKVKADPEKFVTRHKKLIDGLAYREFPTLEILTAYTEGLDEGAGYDCPGYMIA